ncbi:MAG: hypothetical protein JXB32_26150, partial [Deltaproteobacteria bacterium]|nr:hypothetical protein [Deltaproteobacteria bacterium]
MRGPARGAPVGAGETHVGGSRLAVPPAPRRPPLVLDDFPAAALEPERRARLEAILARPPRDRLDALVDQPDVPLLVPAIPPDAFAATLLDVGLQDGDILLVHAADEQLAHLHDITAWTGDELDLDRSLETLEVFRAAGDRVVLRWLRTADDAVLQTLLGRLAVVTADDVPRPDKLDELELGAPFSLDGLFTIWCREPQHEGFLRWLLTMLFDQYQELYLWLCHSLVWVLESEVEHEAYELRVRRLTEHGFPPPDQAAEVFRPVVPERLAPVTVVEAQRTALVADDETLVVVAPEVPAGTGFLGRCVERLAPEERALFRQALERLSRLVLSAELLDPGNPDHRQLALRRAGRTIALALEHLSRGEAALGAALLLERTAVELFRTGHTLLAELPRRAAAVRRAGWLARVPGALGLLEPELRRELEACRRPRPQRFAGVDEEGQPRYEPYASLEELEASRRALEVIDVVGRLLVDGLGLPERFTEQLDLAGLLPSSWAELSAGDLLRTAVVQGVVHGGVRFAPVTGRDLSEFVRLAVERGSLRASVRDEAIDALLARLPATGGTAPRRAVLEGYL